MNEHFRQFFSGNFLAQGHCYLWKSELVWVNAGSDFLITLSCYSISLLLLYFLHRCQYVSFPGIWLLFGLLIICCGTSYLLDIWTIWYPAYWVSVVIKGITALVSLYTVLGLVFLKPKLLAMTSEIQLETASFVLEPEITEYQQTKVRVYEDLEQSVAQLKQKLAQANKRLQAEIKECQQAKSQLQQTQSQLVQNEKMSSLGMMVAGIAHEINNPVNFVCGNITPAKEYIQDLLGLVELYQQHHPKPVRAVDEYANAIDLDFLVKDLPKLLDSMKVGAERTRDIIISLRSFSRMDKTQMTRVNIHDGLESTLLILKHRLKAKPERAEIEVVKNYGVLPPVECYPGQLNQVFMNILANAVDAIEWKGVSLEQLGSEKQTPNLSPRIEICTEVVETQETTPNSQSVVIRIRDNGPGIKERVRRLLFDPFFTTKPVGQGTGLGLSISYQIVVTSHNGQLDCVSMPGTGTEFIIQIPVQQLHQKFSRAPIH